MKFSSDKDDFKDKFNIVYAEKIKRMQKMKQDAYQFTVYEVQEVEYEVVAD
ncbi:hypothetical protein P4K67_22040 [Bacillus cereus]|nr:hypothetical protein [Bacillus cereus]